MVIIDGSQGEGGGQVLRSSLALSMVTGKPVRIENVRARRSPPGLRPQHLAALKAAAQVGNAKARGAEVGSTGVEFEPGSVTPRHYRFDIGTAGSTTLVLQTVLPALVLADGPSEVVIGGGTHNTKAPPAEFLLETFLPLLNRMGPRVEAVVERCGFYPRGGGVLRATIVPVPKLAALQLEGGGEASRPRAEILSCSLPAHVAEREAAVIRERLGLREHEVRTTPIDAFNPANAVLIRVERGGVREVFSAVGVRGKRAEEVATEAADEAREYLRLGAPVGPHLADQLLLPMALAGCGSFLTGPLTDHTTTNTRTILKFLDVPIGVEAAPGGLMRVSFG